MASGSLTTRGCWTSSPSSASGWQSTCSSTASTRRPTSACAASRWPVTTSRLIDVRPHMDLIANSIVWTPARARHLVAKYLESANGCGCGPNGCGPASPELDPFVVRALSEKLTGEDVFRIVLTNFLDAHTF